MSAKLYTNADGCEVYALPGGERNTRLVMTKRLAMLKRPDVQSQLRDCQDLLDAHRMNRLLRSTRDLASKSR